MNKEDFIASGLIELYALGQTSPAETRLVEDWMEKDQSVLDEVRTQQEVLELLAMENAVPPPPGLKAGIMEQIAQDKFVADQQATPREQPVPPQSKETTPSEHQTPPQSKETTPPEQQVPPQSQQTTIQSQQIPPREQQTPPQSKTQSQTGSNNSSRNQAPSGNSNNPWKNLSIILAVLLAGAIGMSIFLATRNGDQEGNEATAQQGLVGQLKECGEALNRERLKSTALNYNVREAMSFSYEAWTFLSDTSTTLLSDTIQNSIRALVYRNASSGKRLIVFLGIPRPETGKEYQAWVIKPGSQPEPAGLPTRQGQAPVPYLFDFDEEAVAIALSIEPEGGSTTGIPTLPVQAAFELP